MKKLFVMFLVLVLFSSYSLAAKNDEINFEDVALNDAISYMREVTGVNIHVQWRALALSGVDKETTITLKVRKLSYSRVLDLICSQLNSDKDQMSSIYWTIDRGVVEITTGNILDTKSEIRVIDVSDLLLIVPNFKGPRIDMEMKNNQDKNQSKGLFGDDNNEGGGDDDKNRYEESPEKMRKRIRETLKNIFIESVIKLTLESE